MVKDARQKLENRPPSNQNQPTVHNSVLQQQHVVPTYPVPSNQQQPTDIAPITNTNDVVYARPNVVQCLFGYSYKKSVVEAYLLYLTFGLFGAHHFYLRRPGFGCLYLLTFGLLGCGYVFDLFRLPCLVRNANRRRQDPTLEDEKRLDDAYALWFPFGLIGFHHFYLRHPGQGMVYLCTFGLLGIGWIVDAFRMPSMVKAYNKSTLEERRKKNAYTAYIFGLSPFGILGAHHFYLDRMMFCLIYLHTFGLLGVGWIVDWFRISILTKRANEHMKGINLNRKYLDDAYVLAIPFGFTGLHHLYLGRPCCGLLYFCTFGIFGLGLLVDLVRMPWLVEEYNHNNCDSGIVPFVHEPPNGNASDIAHMQGSTSVVVTGAMPNPGYAMPAPMKPPPYYQGSYGSMYPAQHPAMYNGMPESMSPPGNMAVPPPAYTENDTETAGPLPPKE